MKVRASERDASLLAISQRAQPKFDEVKVRASERDASLLAISQRAQPKFDKVKVASERVCRNLFMHATSVAVSTKSEFVQASKSQVDLSSCSEPNFNNGVVKDENYE